jgi:hypothetical protein
VLHAAARKAWATAFNDVVAQARERVEFDFETHDRGLAPMRMRFGVYFYDEAVKASAVVPAKTAPRKAAKKIKPAPAIEVSSTRKQPASVPSNRTRVGPRSKP